MRLIKADFSIYNEISRILLDNYTFTQLKVNADSLYEIISEMLLDNENLFFYCTQRSSCRTFKDTRLYVKELMKKNILKTELNAILMNLKWDKDSIDINSTKFCGDLGEYLMSIIIEKFDISNTLISKVSLKTSPSMPAFGNDNVFYDYQTNTLYYGEAKFYDNTINALSNAFDSITKHSKSLQELSFIKNQSSSFVAENGKLLKKIEKRLETIDASQISITSISFIVSDDNYEENDYVDALNKFAGTHPDKLNYINNSIIVFLPVISKTNFLNYFEGKVKSL